MPVPLPRLGERCVLRYRLPDGSATDVIGELVAVGPEVVTVSPRPGESVTVEGTAVLALKRVPQVPRGRDPRRISAADLEQVAALGWMDRAERLGQWWLRAAGGFTGRANSACAVGDPGVSLPVAAQTVIDFAIANSIAPLAQVVSDSPEDIGLVALGWTETRAKVDVLVMRLSDLVKDRAADSWVQVSDELGCDWYAAFHRHRPIAAPDELVRRLLRGEGQGGEGQGGEGQMGQVGFGGAYDGDGLARSIGRGHLVHDWLGVASLWTEPRHRRRGLATAVLIGLGHWAARRGARNVYLQVAQDNADAHTLYGRLGFTCHHTYRYLRPPGQEAA